MKKNIQRLISWLQELFQTPYRYVYIEDIPEQVIDKTIYIIGTEEFPWLLLFICPCGCKQKIHLNLLTDTRPYWKYKISWENKISVSPSIFRKVGCESHFFVIKSKIKWTDSFK